MRSKRTKGRIWPKVMSSALAIALVVTSLLSGAGTVTVKAAGADEQVAAFVERMYTEALGRASEPDGKADWTDQLLSHTSDGAKLAEGFIRSAEFENRGLSDEDYVKTLYKTFFDREPDEGGYNNWLGLLKAGTSRESVLSGFVDSAEFANLCVSFGISQGYMFDNGVVANPGIGLFVYRLYDTLLGRTPDGGGLFDWTMKIATNQFSAAQVATESFILSQEFQQRQEGMNDPAYVDTLYATFFNRKADRGEMSYWLGQLAWGAKRTDVVYGFAGAEEFKNLQAGYGLEIKETPAYEVAAEPPQAESGDENCQHNIDVQVLQETFPGCTGRSRSMWACTKCGYIQETVYDSGIVETHAYGIPIIVSVPTCSTEGEQYHICANCGKEEEHYTMPANPDAHVYEKSGESVVEPGCPNSQRIVDVTYTCTLCGASYSSEEVAAADSHPDSNGDGECDYCHTPCGEPDQQSEAAPEQQPMGDVQSVTE